MYRKALHFNLTDFTLSEFYRYKLRKQKEKNNMKELLETQGKLGQFNF